MKKFLLSLGLCLAMVPSTLALAVSPTDKVTVTGVDFGARFPLGNEACTYRAPYYPYERCVTCGCYLWYANSTVQWDPNYQCPVVGYSSKPVKNSVVKTYCTSNGFTFNYSLSSWNTSGKTALITGEYTDFPGSYTYRYMTCSSLTVASDCEHNYSKTLGGGRGRDLSIIYVDTVSKPYPFTTVVPEFTPTAINLKNCRFSPHDGITSFTGSAANIPVTIDGGQWEGEPALNSKFVTIKRGEITDTASSKSIYTLDPDSTATVAYNGSIRTTTVKLTNPPIIIDWGEFPGLDIDLSAPTIFFEVEQLRA